MDSRRYSHNWYYNFSEKTMSVEIPHESESNDEEENLISIPVKYEVCDTCSGKGKVVNPNIDDNGLSAEDFDRDPDFAENYFGGMYDINCPHCSGLRLAIVPNFDAMNPKLAQEVTEYIQDYYSDQYEDYQTRRMESGGWDY